MTIGPFLPNRQSHRHPGFDYSSAGAYFVTFCVQSGRCLLGEVLNHEMVLNDAGRMVETHWYGLAQRFPSIALDEFRVMPNHVHLLLWLQLAALSAPVTSAPTLGSVIGAFKSLTTNGYIDGVKKQGWPRFEGKLWQRDYWDRIVRNDQELSTFRDYIRANPARWQEDQLHPAAPPNQFNRWNA